MAVRPKIGDPYVSVSESDKKLPWRRYFIRKDGQEEFARDTDTRHGGFISRG